VPTEEIAQVPEHHQNGAVLGQRGQGSDELKAAAEGANDARRAIECDGDRHPGPDKWVEDAHRQRVLDRLGSRPAMPSFSQVTTG